MADVQRLMAMHRDLSEKDQKKAGKALKGAMASGHAAFLKRLIALLDSGDIRTDDPSSILKKDVYDSLSEEWRGKVDLALLNIADQLRLIEQFYRSKETPDSSPHLQTMIEHLWQMKQRIEKHHDVFKF